MTFPRQCHDCITVDLGHEYGSDVPKVLRDDPSHAVHNSVPCYIALRAGQTKYIRYLAQNINPPEELYDLTADPDELTNLAARPEQRAVLEAIREATISRADATWSAPARRSPPSYAAQRLKPPQPFRREFHWTCCNSRRFITQTR